VHYVAEHPEILNPSGSWATPADLLPASDVRVLLVDDNARYRLQLRRMVSRAYPQAVIYEAGNVSEAVRLVEEVMPKLVLVDVILGEEDGIHCARRIKSAWPQARVILITAYPDREFRRLGLEAGASALLDKKDLDAASLRLMIDDVLA
jgi:DNA-binding NarL/FixJ family response regulator